MDHQSEKTWEYFGEHDPYYGVLTRQDYHRENMDDEARRRFFETGKKHMALVEQLILEQFSRQAPFRRALDFGCGVGRILAPMAQLSQTAVGVDIADAMLVEASKNCERLGFTNVSFVKADDDLSQVSGEFDLIHSFIVFQHISPEKGLKNFSRLVDLLADDGVAAIHIVYEREMTSSRRLFQWMRRSIPFANSFANLVLGAPTGTPYIPMYAYDLNALYRLLRLKDCRTSFSYLVTEKSETTTSHGVLLLFQKKTSARADRAQRMISEI